MLLCSIWCRAGRSSRAVFVFCSGSGRSPQRTRYHVGREAPPSQKARLPGALGEVGRRRVELAFPHRERALQFAVAKRLGGLRRQRHLVLLELLANAQVAEARCPRMNARFDEALLGQVLLRFQPVEHGIDARRRGGCARTWLRRGRYPS